MWTKIKANEYKPLILIVDDVVENLKVLGNVFREEGFAIAIAPNGAEAMTIAKLKKPDLILLDVSMPLLDGFEVCRMLKKTNETSAIPIIFLTARTETEDLIKGFEAGAVDYVSKPFKYKELLARVKTHLELKYSRDKISLYVNELEKKNVLLAESQAKLTETLNAKDTLFSIIAHDLKNPIATLLNSTKLLSKEIETLTKDEIILLASEYGKSIGNLLNLTDNLLTWSRSQLGQIPFHVTNCSLPEIADAAVALYKPMADSKSIRLYNSVNEELHAYVDFNMISTIVRNLTSNAVKFTPKGGEIEIYSVENESKVDIVVRDTGVGISAEDCAKLFRPDVYFTNEGTSQEKGTGLGLSICREFAVKHGGDLTVQSEEGLGSRFILSIPKKAI